MTHAFAVVPPAPNLVAGLRPLAIVPRTLEEASHMAKTIVASGLAPQGLDTPEACLIAILHGLELGLTPCAAIQRIAVIDRRPTLWGDGAMALVRASGQCQWVREDLEGETTESWSAVCSVKRRGEGRPVERRFSVQDARRAGLWGRPGPWSQYPQRMLQMRARAFALRDAFADVLGGLYLREEMEDADTGGRWGSAEPLRAPPPSPPDPTILSAEVPVEVPAAPDVLSPPTPARDAVAADKLSAVTADRIDPVLMTAAGDPAAADILSPPRPNVTAASAASRLLPPRRPAPREALRSRYAQGWSVRQPRTLAARRPSPFRAPPPPLWPSSGIDKPEADILAGTPFPPAKGPRATPDAPEAGRTSEADTKSAASRPVGETAGPPSLPQSDPETLLGDYDNALSCARDQEVFTEIDEEFAPKLDTLSREHRARAHRTRQRHAARLAALTRPGPEGNAP